MFNQPLVPGLSASDLQELQEKPTPAVVSLLQSIEGMQCDPRSTASDIYQLISYCPPNIQQYANGFSAGNLADRNHEAVEQAKKAVLAIVRDLVGTRHLLGGIIAPGGTGANALAINIAREKHRNRSVIAASENHHVLIDPAAEQAQMSIESYSGEQQLQDLLRKKDTEIAALIVTAPCTNFGIVENISNATLKHCKQLGIHIHVDAACGLLVEPNDLHYARNELVDSMTADPHKMVGKPNCSMLLLRQSEMDTAFTYYSPADEICFGSTQSPEGTVAAAMHFHALGKSGIRALRKFGLDMATMLSETLERKGFSMLNTNRHAPFVSIALSSEESVKLVRLALRPEYEVASVKARTENGPCYGIRLVLTPKPHITEEFMESFVTKLEQIRREHPQSFVPFSS